MGSEGSALWRLLEVIAAERGHGSGQLQLQLPGGLQWQPHRLSGPVHVVDGDGASLCEQVPAAELVPIGPAAWTAAHADRRCPACQFLVTFFRGGTGEGGTS